MPFIAPIIEVGIAAFGAISSFVAATGIIGQGLIAAGIGVASSYLISKLTPNASAGTDLPGGVNLQREYGGNISRKVATGVVGIAGHDTYVNTFGEANGVMQQVYTLSDYYSTALNRVAINGVYASLGADDGNFGQPVTSGDFANLIFIKFLDGRQTTANDHLVGNANPSGRWANTNVGYGITAVIVTLFYDKDKNNSFPDFFFEFKGAPIYDWRKDSTNGGSGSHRWNDYTTHEFTENPILIARHYRRGFSVNGDIFCGMDMQEADLPVSKWTAAANICDELQPDSFPLYRASVMLDCMSSHSANLQSLSYACGAMEIDTVDGSWPLVGSEQPSVLTFTDEDLISVASNFKYNQHKSMSELVNSVTGSFPDPNQLWSMVGYQDQVADAFVILDRRTRDISMDFPMVPYSRQAAQLAWIYLYENRYEASATVTLRPRFQVLEVGDWLDWNSARYGLKTFIVTGKSLLSLDSDGPRNAILTLQQRDGQIYDGVSPPDVVVPIGNNFPEYLSEVENFQCLPVTVVGDTGKAAPGIRASWNALTDVTVTSVELMYYPANDTAKVFHKTVPFDQIVVFLSEGVVGATEYEIRAKIITTPPRTTVFNAGATVTTTNIGISLVDLNAEIQYQLTTLQNQLTDSIANFENLVASLGMNQDARNWLDKKSIRSQLASRSGAAFAAIDEVKTVATDTQTAFAAYQITVSATFDDVNASITTNETAIATLDGFAAASYSVALDVNHNAIGFHLFNGGPNTGVASFVVDNFYIALNAGAGGTQKKVFTIGTVGGVSTIGINANMFIDGTITATMMNVLTVSAITANLGTVTAGTLQDPAGKLLIDLNNTRIVISQ